jgi:hypothetical protein
VRVVYLSHRADAGIGSNTNSVLARSDSRGSDFWEKDCRMRLREGAVYICEVRG